MAANVNVSVMADRTPITVAIVRPHTTELPEGTNIFSELSAHKK
ncbi:MAG: hypothetical protein ACM3X1_07245 [Ignavibacteriales bacterium]